jgi:DNA-binding protein H-NS
MPNLRFEKLSATELLDIRDYIDSLLKKRVVDERRKLEKLIARIDQSESARVMSGRALSKLKGQKIAPKYRHPETGETWAGRGATPVWLRALLKLGRTLDEFAIGQQATGKKRRVPAKRTKRNRRTAKRSR